MKVHVVGNGGREHALRNAMARTAELVETADAADLVVIGPEVPLVAGMADDLRAKGKLVYGPGKDGAQIEGSKKFMKDFAARAGLPTAKYGTFNDVIEATGFLEKLKTGYVIKTDGLAAGKGVLVTTDFDEAVTDITDKLSGASFGEAGRRVIVEELMTGPEVSIMYVFDGKKGVALPAAQDFKRAQDGDAGPNTGGMGAYSTIPFVDDAMLKVINEAILIPTGEQLQRDGIDYRGTLYAGLMITPEGPKLIEYNVRFGDPETQAIMPRMNIDVAELLASAAAGDLTIPSGDLAVTDQAVTITLASAGYPVSSRKDDVITGIDEAESLPGVTVFQAGTATNDAGQLVTNGGRVLNVTALAPTLRQARERAYEAVKRIHFDGMHYRSDIAFEASEV